MRSFPLVGSPGNAVEVDRVVIRRELRVLVEFVGRKTLLPEGGEALLDHPLTLTHRTLLAVVLKDRKRRMWHEG